MRIKLLSALAFVIALSVALAYAPLHLSAWASGPSDTIGPLVEYTDDVFHFTVSYPLAISCASTPKTTMASAPSPFESPDDEHAYQIFVVPYAESAITPERFRTDAPSGVMIDPKEMIIDGAPAKSFFG